MSYLEPTPGGRATVANAAPAGPLITAYDRLHHATYLALLDHADRRGCWREGATTILGLDPAAAGAWNCWRSHLARAEWMRSTGWRQLLPEKLPPIRR